MNESTFLFARPGFVGGVARLFDFAGTLNTYNISPSGELADARAFQEDWKAIGDDMRKALQDYQKNKPNQVDG